jgi:cytochrome c oxidase subunit IV
MSGHVAPKSMYYAVFAALMVGTALTVLVAFYDLGPLNNVLMLTIAMTKALLVILFFITMSDYLTRGWVEGTLK